MEPSEKVLFQPIPQKTLDDLAYVFAESSVNRGDQPNKKLWQIVVAELADTGYTETSLPHTTQKLAAILMNATTNMFACNLPSSSRILPQTHTDNPKAVWGQKHMTHPDINNTNYHYVRTRRKTGQSPNQGTHRQTNRKDAQINRIHYTEPKQCGTYQ